MSIIADRYVHAYSLSEGWLDTARLLCEFPSRKAVHLLVRIDDPLAEIEAIRDGADALVDAYNAGHSDQMKPVDTVANTIFPSVWADRTNGPEELGAYYRERYPELRRIKQNARGTYFGRIVAYPRDDEEDETADQLEDTIRKLGDELGGNGGAKSSRYEINIYNERKDTSPMGFPCLAHLSVHLHEGSVHMQAVYRNEYLVGRAYGNWLGLARLQAYVAEESGVDVGELLLTIGHTELDGSKTAVKKLVERLT